MKTESAELELRQKHVGRFLKMRREKASLTQQDVAKHLDYTSPQFVSNWERGVSLPPIDALPRLAALYEIAAKEMIDTMHRYQVQLIDHQKKELTKLFQKGGSKRGRG